MSDLFLIFLAAICFASQSSATPLGSQIDVSPEAKDATYDYVIIGGGTAGLAMANRLSKNKYTTVAVIEAGGYYENEDFNSVAPGLSYAYFNTSAQALVAPVDWGIKTVPQAAVGGSSYLYSRGKTLGENAMIYNRGTVGSYAKWAEMVGDDAYHWDNFLPFFEKSVNYTLPDYSRRAANATVPPPQPNSYSANGGPVHVWHTDYAMPWASWAQKAMHEVGIPTAQDFSSGSLLGAQYAPQLVNPDTRERSSSETSYLRAALARNYSNLAVYKETLAKRIIFTGKNRAHGVLVTAKDGTRFHVFANKEVILSAGAFQSPQLLMVSGIGPKATLKKHGIPPVSILPGVGQGMQDHVFFSLSYPTKLATKQRFVEKGYYNKQFETYKQSRTGVLITSAEDFIGWEKVPEKLRSSSLSQNARRQLEQFPPDWPELELIAGSVPNPMASRLFRDYAQLYVAIVAPLSRGTVDISSDDTSDMPLVNPNWFSNETDKELAIAGFKRAREIFAAPSLFPGFGPIIGLEASPGILTLTDAQIWAFIQQMFLTVWHASCTCAMGKKNDPMAVLDSHAKVFGVEGLRVVDASAMPLLPPGHPTSTIYALAEKIAHDIQTGN